MEYGLGEQNKENKQACKYTALLYVSRLHLFIRNILTHLNTVIPDRMKGTEEEVLLNPYPVLVGISKW